MREALKQYRVDCIGCGHRQALELGRAVAMADTDNLGEFLAADVTVAEHLRELGKDRQIRG